MQTVVLATDDGGGMGPLAETRPRVTLPVSDRPLLAHALDAAAEAGATRFVVVVGDRGDAVGAAVGDEHAGVPVEYVRRPVPGGPVGAIAAASDRLTEDPFAVLDGGALYDARSLGDLYRRGPAVAAVPAERPPVEGALRTAANGGAVVAVDRSGERLVPAGAYSFPATAVARTDALGGDAGDPDLEGLLSRIYRSTDVRAVRLERWLAVRRPWDLLAANEWKLGDLPGGAVAAGEVSRDATLSGTVVVEEGATVRPGSVLEGPILVRAGATVGPNAYVRGATLVGPDARVGHAVEVKNSVLMAEASVGHLSYVGDSVLGRAVNFGAGTVTANLRHDEADVRVTVDGERVSTGRRKFGVVVGDDAKTGITTGLNAGVTLSTGARTGVGESVTRDH